ncbi:ribonuclease P protein component [Saccharothrix variisporea]|uniref:Ribonuclease P protein component n=1 Tax=Saccharothrix variisporea TaxID=543527 RepID=A0A495XE48_9PSEU|nr:ribonuclease P protein component [Saccharothrix variisporea]RKT71536.1 ribonuclease P protein component [Saccharothrix variisporea]
MLPAANRLTRSQDFGLVVRRGRRAGRPRLVVHALVPTPAATPVAADDATAGSRTSAQPTLDVQSKVGFVVSKAVGNSVVRHRVSRRLRHVVRDRLPGLPPGSSLVVRALAPAATASSADLAADLDAALRRLLR